MKKSKVLSWVLLLLVGITISATVFAPTNRAYAQTAQATPNDSCSTDGNPLDWILCPVFNGVADVSGYLFQNIIVPLLKVPPVSTNPSDASFDVWNTFRIYGNIVLVVAIIVIVFGEVVGGGVIDAYTARKVLPKILVATILVNLSVYIVAGLVDLTNIIGSGIGSIIISPFKDNHQLNFSLSTGQNLGVFGIGFLGLFLTVGSVGVTLLALFTNPGTVVFMGLLAVLPVVFAIIAVFATLIFRQGVILFLVMVSPIAFALYCLPNTERIFKRWWDFLLEALMVYPIVIIIFAVADVLAGTILQANNIDLSTGTDTSPPNFVGHTLAAVTAFVLQFAPLFLVPFAFRMASGTLGRIHEFVTKGSTTLGGFVQQRTEGHKINKYNPIKNQSRDRLYEAGKSRSAAAAKQGHGGRRWMYDTFLTNRLGSNPQADDSKAQAEMNERVAGITNTGKDGVVRGLTVDKEAALATAEGEEWKDGVDQFGRAVRLFKSAGGGWVSEADVDKAHNEFGHNKYAFQSAMSYEMGKAASQDEVDHLVSSYAGLAQHQGFTQDQAAAAWTGAAYGNQNQNLQYKHTKWQRDETTHQLRLATDGAALMREVDEKRGSGQLAAQNADTFTSMSAAYEKAMDDRARATTADDRAKAEETIVRAQRIAQNLAGTRAQRVNAPADEGGNIDLVGGTAPSWAPARVQQEQDRFVQLVIGRAGQGPSRDADDALQNRDSNRNSD